MGRTPNSVEWPIGIPRRDKVRYMTMWRWLKRHTGPIIYTELELAAALLEPTVFYIAPLQYRSEDRDPNPIGALVW